MENPKTLLAQTMAVLMSTTPDTKLGKLLNLCLAAKVDPLISGKTPRAFAEKLVNEPIRLSQWIQEVVDSDADYSVDEMLAISEMQLQDSQQFSDTFLAALWQELDAMDLAGVLAPED